MKTNGDTFLAGIFAVSRTVLSYGAQSSRADRKVDGVPLAINGQSDYQIVVTGKISDAEIINRLARTACLMQAAFKANGCDMPVVSERQSNSEKPGRYLGNTEKARANGVAVEDLADWGYALKVVGRDVIS